MLMFRASFVLALLVVLTPGSRECEARRPGVLAWRRRPSRIDTTAAVGLGGGKLSNWLRNRRSGKPARAAHDDEQPLVEIVDDPNEDPKGDNMEWDEGALVEKEGGVAPRDRGILESSAEYLGLRGGNPKALLVQLGRAAIVASAAYIIGEKAFKFVRARKGAAAEAENEDAIRRAVKDAAKDADKPAGAARAGATSSGDKQENVEPPAEEPHHATPEEDGYHELVDDFEEEQRLEQELAAEHEQQLDQAVLDEIEAYEEAETMFYGRDNRVEPPPPPPPSASATSSPHVDEDAAKPSP